MRPDLTTVAASLLRALVTPAPGRRAAHLVRLSPTGALLVMPDRGETLHVLLPDETLDERVRALLRQRAAGKTHVAVVGGGERTLAILRRARPRLSLERSVAMHLVDGGIVQSVGGRLRRLEEAAEEAETSTTALPLDATEVAASQARLRDAIERGLQTHAALVRKAPLATWALLGICTAVYALEMTWGGAESVSTLWRMGANDAERVALGDAWRVLASSFLHSGVLHLGINLFALWSLGTVLERLVGTRRFLVLWGAGALGGGVATVLAGQATLTVGASGALFGLVAAVVFLPIRRPDLVPRPRRRQLRRQLTAPILLVVMTGLSPGSDFFAHAGGALTGFLLALWPTFTRTATPPGVARGRGPLELNVAALSLAGILLASLWFAFDDGRPWELAAPPVSVRLPLGDSGLSIQVPERLARHPPERAGAAMRWTFGEHLRDPLTLEVWVAPQEGPALDEGYERMKASVPGGATSSVVLAQDGGRPLIMLDRRLPKGEHLREWLADQGDWRVVVRAVSVEHMPPGWMATRDRIGTSVRVGR